MLTLNKSDTPEFHTSTHWANFKMFLIIFQNFFLIVGRTVSRTWLISSVHRLTRRAFPGPQPRTQRDCWCCANSSEKAFRPHSRHAQPYKDVHHCKSHPRTNQYVLSTRVEFRRKRDPKEQSRWQFFRTQVMFPRWVWWFRFVRHRRCHTATRESKLRVARFGTACECEGRGTGKSLPGQCH